MQTRDNIIEPHEPHWLNRSAFQIVIILFFITEIALVIVLQRGEPLWLVIPFVLLASHFIHGAAVGFHEATHGLLRRNRRLNGFDGVLLGVFSFMSFSLYRAAHQLHHMHLATVILESKPGSSDRSIYASVRTWVDSRRLVPLGVEKYSTSGQLARRMDTTRVVTNNGHAIPANMTVHDAQKSTTTDLDGSNIKHAMIYDDATFTKKGLRQTTPPRTP